MPLKYTSDSLFDSNAQVIVNTVNTVGVMGKGIAKVFKRKHPKMFQEYKRRCTSGDLEIGKLYLYNEEPDQWVLNFPTKKHWRQPSKPEYIEKGLAEFVRRYESMGIESIAFPKLGCGNGELNWERQVKPLMERYLSDLPVEIFVHEYNGLGKTDVRDVKRRRLEIPEQLPLNL